MALCGAIICVHTVCAQELPSGGRLFPVTETPKLQEGLSRCHLQGGKYIQPHAVAKSAEDDRNRYKLINGKSFPAELRYLLYIPDPSIARDVPLIVYFPGSGETGFDLTKQFHHRSIFSLVSSPKFQNEHPCYLMAISLPEEIHTVYDRLPGQPSAIQDLVMGAVRAVAVTHRHPQVDATRHCAVGFSFGGECVYGIMLAYPGSFA